MNPLEEILGNDLYAKFEAALDVARVHDPEDIIAGIQAGEMYPFFWPPYPEKTKTTFAVAQVIDYPKCRLVHVFLICGDLDEVFGPVYDEIEKFALEHGADRMTACGRMGWARTANKHGFESLWTGVRYLKEEKEDE